jgi:hypothetical protein
VIALPPHRAPGASTTDEHVGYGDVDARGVLACQERRTFARCNCLRSPEAPTRGAEKCRRCHTVGNTIASRAPGCGREVASCPGCGNRTIWMDQEQRCQACGGARKAT